jgi:hypothetical protein
MIDHLLIFPGSRYKMVDFVRAAGRHCRAAPQEPGLQARIFNQSRGRYRGRDGSSAASSSLPSFPD